jgi:hypothetical protein
MNCERVTKYLKNFAMKIEYKKLSIKIEYERVSNFLVI